MERFIKPGLVCVAILTCLGLGSCAEKEKPEVRRVLSSLDGSWLVVVKSACGGVLFESYIKASGPNDYRKSSEKCLPGVYAGASVASDGKSILASIHKGSDGEYVLSEMTVTQQGVLADGAILNVSKSPLRFPVKIENKYIYLRDFSQASRGGEWEILSDGVRKVVPGRNQSWRYAYYPTTQAALVVKLDSHGGRSLVSLLGPKDAALEQIVATKKLDWLSCSASGRCVGGGGVGIGENYWINDGSIPSQMEEPCKDGSRPLGWIGGDAVVWRCMGPNGGHKSCSFNGNCFDLAID